MSNKSAAISNEFRPDLVFEEDGTPVIVELQQHALDRYHLYKTLEYRDQWQSITGCKTGVILICERIDDRYVPLAKTHSVKVITIPRDTFIEIAVKHCESSVIAALSNSHQPETPKPGQATNRFLRANFEPLGWAEYQKPIDYLKYIYSELARLNISFDEIPRDWYKQIFAEIERFIESDISQTLSTVCNPEDWNAQRLLLPRGKGLRKPKIEIVPFVTAKRNLSVLWYPNGRSRLSEDTDWTNFREYSYGWDRPQTS